MGALAAIALSVEENRKKNKTGHAMFDDLSFF